MRDELRAMCSSEETNIPDLTGLNYRARAAEQLLIQAYRGPKNTLMNKISSIAAKRFGLYKKAVEEATKLVKSGSYL